MINLIRKKKSTLKHVHLDSPQHCEIVSTFSTLFLYGGIVCPILLYQRKQILGGLLRV